MAPASNQKIIRSFEPGSSRGDLDLLELGKGRASLAIYDLRSQSDIETGVGEPPKGNSIKVFVPRLKPAADTRKYLSKRRTVSSPTRLTAASQFFRNRSRNS